jgi:VPDSG-CTERM motif
LGADVAKQIAYVSFTSRLKQAAYALSIDLGIAIAYLGGNMKLTMKINNIVPSIKLPLIAVAACMAMVAFTPNASAARKPMPPQPFHLLDPVQFFTNGPIGSGTDENTFLQGQGLLPATSQYLGKFNAGGGFENGALNISQFVTINVINSSTWDISWDLTGSGFTLDGVLIKDGRVQGKGHLYRFYGVSADETLIGSGTVTFDNPVRGISHISFFGSPGGQVPDGGTTVMLLGAALGALGMVRRFLMS